MVPMPKEPPAPAPPAGPVDPLNGVPGLSLFPRTLRASADVPVQAAPKDLDSIHNLMKSLKELISPEKLMNEAKKIVDGGVNLLSNFPSFTENVSATNDLAPKVKDRPRERRQGLGIARKKASFTLKTSVSHPAVKESTLDIDHLEDPDAFFDAYERIEKANKEIQKHQGGTTGHIDHHVPSNNVRRRRPGILGRSYSYEHRYSSVASENDDMWVSSQETLCLDIPSPPKDESPEKLVYPDPDPDPNLDADMEEVELGESMKKTESQVNDMLEDLLSCNDEDLEGQGALNILQERLKIKSLDLENLCRLTELPDVGRSNVSASLGSWQKPRNSSSVFDSVLESLNKKPRMEQKHGENPIIPASSPTPPRFPLGSISLLEKKVLQISSLRDPYSPEDIDLCSSPVEPKDKLPGQVATAKDLGTCIESDSPVISDIDSHQVMIKTGSLPEQSQSENASMERESARSRANASPLQPKDRLVAQAGVIKDLAVFSEMESNVEFDSTTPPLSNLDTMEVTGNGDDLHDHEQLEDENASITSMDASGRQNEESTGNIGNTMNTNENESNPSVVEEEAKDDMSTEQQINLEQQSEVNVGKQQREKRVGGVKRMKDAHPMRKSLAEAGTSFEGGVRRSKRIKMRPLEYWKGERFLYGRVDNSLKLIGLKYISPGKGKGKGDGSLKVKPYIMSKKPEHKELLDLAARH